MASIQHTVELTKKLFQNDSHFVGVCTDFYACVVSLSNHGYNLPQQADGQSITTDFSNWANDAWSMNINASGTYVIDDITLLNGTVITLYTEALKQIYANAVELSTALLLNVKDTPIPNNSMYDAIVPLTSVIQIPSPTPTPIPTPPETDKPWYQKIPDWTLWLIVIVVVVIIIAGVLIFGFKDGRFVMGDWFRGAWSKIKGAIS